LTCLKSERAADPIGLSFSRLTVGAGADAQRARAPRSRPTCRRESEYGENEPGRVRAKEGARPALHAGTKRSTSRRSKFPAPDSGAMSLLSVPSLLRASYAVPASSGAGSCVASAGPVSSDDLVGVLRTARARGAKWAPNLANLEGFMWDGFPASTAGPRPTGTSRASMAWRSREDDQRRRAASVEVLGSDGCASLVSPERLDGDRKIARAGELRVALKPIRSRRSSWSRRAGRPLPQPSPNSELRRRSRGGARSGEADATQQGPTSPFVQLRPTGRPPDPERGRPIARQGPP